MCGTRGAVFRLVLLSLKCMCMCVCVCVCVCVKLRMCEMMLEMKLERQPGPDL
jgi:hypothetical protein